MNKNKRQNWDKKIETLISLGENWIKNDMVKATETYKHWQHDKHSYAYGWIMGVEAMIQKLRDIREI